MNISAKKMTLSLSENDGNCLMSSFLIQPYECIHFEKQCMSIRVGFGNSLNLNERKKMYNQQSAKMSWKLLDMSKIQYRASLVVSIIRLML